MFEILVRFYFEKPQWKFAAWSSADFWTHATPRLAEIAGARPAA